MTTIGKGLDGAAREASAGYVPNNAYTHEDWDEVSDNPKLTDAELAELRPADKGPTPALATALKSRGG